MSSSDSVLMDIDAVNITPLARYSSYKDSGVEWLGKIPAHWEVARFRDLFLFDKGLSITKENLKDSGIPCINYGEVHSKYGFEFNPDKHALKCVSEDYLSAFSKSLLNAGDFVFADTSEDVEGAGNFTHLTGSSRVLAGYHTIIARPTAGNNSRFLAYVIESISYRNQIRKNVKGVKVYSITKAILKGTSIWLTSYQEQTAIAEFLDRKTALIDRAISIKQRQITLLKERKQILIQNAVTRGLNPDAPMRDSGVEWIGEIPAHWKILSNRSLFNERVEPGRKELPLLSVSIHSAVSNKEMAEEDNIRGRVKIEDKSQYNLVQPNDVVYNMMRAWQGAIGAVRIEGMVSPAYIIAVPNELIDSSFFEYQYRSPIFIQQMDRNSKGITDFRKRLYWDEFKQLIAVTPPKEEQTAIVTHIEAESSKIDQAIDLQQQQIEKLKEYKATLINSAVTGKIRVLDEYSEMKAVQ